MTLLPGYPWKGENLICCLQKSLYGLKQASRNWFSKFSTIVQDVGYKQSKVDYSLFTLSHGSSFTAILVNVDDIIVTGNHPPDIVALKEFLHRRFHIKDLGPLQFFLVIDVAFSSKCISISQRKYTLEILDDMGFFGARPTPFPMEQNLKLSPDTGELLNDPTLFLRLIGHLIYLMITRPDIVYSIHILSQFMQQPR